MGKLRRLGMFALAVSGGYVLLLLVLGFALRGCVAEQVEQRMAAALDAEVEVGKSSPGLLLGSIELGDIRVQRENGGQVNIEIEHIEVDVAPLGGVVFDRVPELVVVRGVRMSVDAPGVLTLPERPERPPLRLGGMVLEDIDIEMSAIDSIPGLGRARLVIDQARTGPVELKSTLDWIFAVRQLNATARLPGSIEVSVRYGEGTLELGGGLFGSTPVSVPFELPAPPPDALEAEKIRILVAAIIKAAGHEVARRWLEYKARDRIRSLLD